MNSQGAAAFSDVILSLGTLALALTLKNKIPWAALFVATGLASGLGALYHGVDRFHTHEFWVLVSAVVVSSGFQFFGVCFSLSQPQKKWLGWFWPALVIAGILTGVFLSTYPFWYVSVLLGICLLLSVLILSKCPLKKARNWMYLGIITTVAGLVAQHYVSNAVFHYLQLGANLFYWRGAKNS